MHYGTGHRTNPAGRHRLSKGIITFGLLAVTLACGSGCAALHVYPSVKGRVIDKETREPIVGAAVVIQYYTQSASIGGWVRRRARVSETQTDGDGRYTFGKRLIVQPRLPVSQFDRNPRVTIFHPGHELAEARHYLPPHGKRFFGDRMDWTEKDGWVLFLARISDLAKREANWVGVARGLPLLKLPYLNQLIEQERKTCEEMRRR